MRERYIEITRGCVDVFEKDKGGRLVIEGEGVWCSNTKRCVSLFEGGVVTQGRRGERGREGGRGVRERVEGWL